MIDDVDMVGDSEICEKLCKDVYSELKAYLRIARLKDDDPDGEDEQEFMLRPNDDEDDDLIGASPSFTN